MAGLLAILGSRTAETSRDKFVSVCRVMLRRGGRIFRSISARDGKWLLAQFKLSGQTPENPLPEHAGGVTVLFHGVLYNEDALGRAFSIPPTELTDNASGIISKL